MRQITTQHFLCSSRIRLTSLSVDDADQIAEWNQDIGYGRKLNSDLFKPCHAENLKEWLSSVNDESDAIFFAIRPVNTPLLIGFTGFTDIEWANQCSEMVLTIGSEKHRGQGIGREALGLALTYGFNELNLHRIQITVLEYNEPAIRLYEASGFQREGIYREFGKRDGKRYDMYLYGLLEPDWRKE